MVRVKNSDGVVQQLMFNRILAFLQSMSDWGVTVVGFDAETGTLEGRLSGVNFFINVSLREARQH